MSRAGATAAGAALAAVVLCTPARPAVAQAPEWSPAATELCLAQADSALAEQACIGLSAARCIDTPDGYTTVGTSACLGREADWWDGRLNAAYQALMASETALDAEMADLGASAPPMAPALRQMQRAWIGFRDSACAYEVAQWGGGTGAGPAHAACTMRLTAMQAMELERRLADKAAQ